MNSLSNNWKFPRLQAEIALSYKSIKEAEAVAQAVSPDNVKVPPGLFIKTTKQGKKVLTQITCETRLETFMATIDDLLSAVSVAERAVSAVRSR
jgi:hypothetical protein